MTFIQRCKDDFHRKGIVLDIDHVLGTPNIPKRVFPRLVPIYCYGGYFHVFPGVVESLIFFDTLLEVKVTFFSAGINTRNIELVCGLWKMAASRGTRVHQGNILSREHLSKQSGIKVKDISKTLCSFERLSNSVLADDFKLNRARGQKKNFLYVPMTDHANFERLLKLEQALDDEAYQLLSCYITEKYNSQYVREGSYIDVCKSDDGYKVYFLNKDTYKLCKTKLTLANHPRLVGLLNACSTGKLEHPVLLKAIRGLVARKNGKVRRLFLEVNRIYYVVGILFMAIKISQAAKITLTKALYHLQHCKFKKKMIKKKTEIYEEFYHLGLALLKQINPDLSFMNQIDYMNTVSRTAENSEDLTWSDNSEGGLSESDSYTG